MSIAGAAVGFSTPLVIIGGIMGITGLTLVCQYPYQYIKVGAATGLAVGLIISAQHCVQAVDECAATSVVFTSTLPFIGAALIMPVIVVASAVLGPIGMLLTNPVLISTCIITALMGAAFAESVVEENITNIDNLDFVGDFVDITDIS